MWTCRSRFFVLLALTTALALAAAAQSFPLQIDAGHSFATLWVRGGPEDAAGFVNVGVAQAAGRISLVGNDPSSSRVDLAIVPGGEGANLLAPDGTLHSEVVAPLMRYTTMGFHAARARIRRDGRLEFSGQLTVTHVTRQLTQASGNSTVPAYTSPRTTSETHDVRFVLVQPPSASSTSSLQRNLDLVLSARVDNVPQLSGVLCDSDWPLVAEDEPCSPFSDSDSIRDYYGVICPGKANATASTFSRADLLEADLSDSGKPGSASPRVVIPLLHLKLSSPAGTVPAPSGR